MSPISRRESTTEEGRDASLTKPRVTRSNASRQSSAAGSVLAKKPSTTMPSSTTNRSRTLSDRQSTSSRTAKIPSVSSSSSIVSLGSKSSIVTASPPGSSGNSPVKLRKRTDVEPSNLTPKPRNVKAGNGGKTSSAHPKKQQQQPPETSRASMVSINDERIKLADAEPIKAFLRIRPPPPQDATGARDPTQQPYIQVISDTQVLMNPPKQASYSSSRSAARARTYSLTPPTKYLFTKVFGSSSDHATIDDQANSQSNFFQQTVLPMVQDLLHGQSGLVFTYGVTNSGKSYTVMGTDGQGEAGVLPRALDVIFNSIQGLESSSDLRPCGVSAVERETKADGLVPSASTVGINPFSTKKLFNDTIHRSLKTKTHQHDPTKITVDRNLRYSVFVSYVEVYNEKLFDLLDAPPTTNMGGLARSESVRGSNWSIAAMANLNGDFNSHSNGITLNRRPLTLKSDADGGGKYVSGLKEIKVTCASEAHDLLIRGQENRAVFGTMANRASSRSHGVFTIKVIREHGGIQNGDLSSSFSTARLSIVDLAGSERVGNTGLSSGDRLKEAGNINKSLMCLGQCLETLRKNQARVALGFDMPSQSRLLQPEPTPKKRLSIVPFRHSKLTELFQSFFTGEGKAVMIVNANPYDTGFDENSHVMKFSAIAKEVSTARPQASVAKPLAVSNDAIGRSRGVTSTTDASYLGGLRGAKIPSQLDVVETSEPEEMTLERHDITIIEDDDEGDGDESDPFVDMLVEKHEELRQRLYAAEMRCAMIETEVREEMANEMEQRLLEMESMYNQRMLNEAEQNEQFMNRKIDLLVRTNIRQDSARAGESMENEEAEVERSLVSSGRLITPFELAADYNDESDDDSTSSHFFQARTPQPLQAFKGKLGESHKVNVDNDESMEDGSDEQDDHGDDDDDAGESMESEASDEEEEEEEEDSDDNSSDEEEEEKGKKDSEQDDSEDDSEDASDSSFDITVATADDEPIDSSDEETKQTAAPKAGPRQSTGRKSSLFTKKAAGKTPRSSRARFNDRSQDVTVIEPDALTDISDASMIAEDLVTPKRKRKLRKKAAVQEDDMVEQIGDSSLVEAVSQRSMSMSKSTGRKSMR